MLHFSLLLFIVTFTGYSSIRQYLKNSAQSVVQEQPNKLENISYSLLTAPFIRQYLLISGSEANYAFFAPKVSSCFLIEYIYRDHNNIERKRLYEPFGLRTHEGIQRYAFLPYSFQKKITSRSNNKQLSLNNILLESLAKSALKRQKYENVTSVTANLVVYQFPDHNFYKAGNKTAILIDIANFTVRNK
jgi:hypothetical protein